jgi:cytoskeletal protein CcmA (bactofilin family)
VLFNGGLRIDGQVSGDVSGRLPGQGYLVLASAGQICGDIRAAHVVIDGRINGNLHVSGRVELLSRARIIGDIHYVPLSMRPGAIVVGQLCPTAPASASDASYPGSLPAVMLKLA